MYTSTKDESAAHIKRSAVAGVRCLTMAADFWTCPTQGSQYLGVRVYFVDPSWTMKSILLGVRKFNPEFGERGSGIRRPFKRWLTELLANFGLKCEDFFAGMSDGGSDIKWMLSNGLGLYWEWCVAHMSNAATKHAFGLEPRSSARNPEMTDLVADIRLTIRLVKGVNVMGCLFEALCELEGGPKAVKLLDYRSHRFLGLTRVIERILEKWSPLEQWFAARLESGAGSSRQLAFPLAGRQVELVQLLSLLKPVTVLNAKSQAEQPVQAHALLTLYHLRMVTLNKSHQLHYYKSTPDQARFLVPSELKPIVAAARSRLADAIDSRFFSRYTDSSKRQTTAYVYEMQLFVHPQLKHLDLTMGKTIKFCNAQLGVAPDVCSRIAHMIKSKVHSKVKRLMLEVATSMAVLDAADTESTADDSSVAVPDDLLSFFGCTAAPAESAAPVDATEGRVEEEFHRWLAEPSSDNPVALTYWQRQADSNNYKYLPVVAKILFAVPMSSAQIDRDFGQCGRMVTSLRTSLSASKVDMSAFLACNQDYLDLSQCAKIPGGDAALHVPTSILVGMLQEIDNEMDVQLQSIFSSASIDEDMKE